MLMSQLKMMGPNSYVKLLMKQSSRVLMMLLFYQLHVSYLIFTSLKLCAIYRVASRPEISGNLEKSGNFVALENSLGIS